MKVLKVAAIVVGVVALAATGVGLAAGASLGAAFAGGAMTVGAALGVSGGLVAGVFAGALLIDVMSLAGAIGPKASQGGSQTKWKADPYAGLPYVMGRTLVSGNIVLRRGHGPNNQYESFATVLSVGPVQSIDTSFLNKTTVAYGVNRMATGTYEGQAWQTLQLGACPEPVALMSACGDIPGWTAAHKLSGLAASMNTFLYDTKRNPGLTSEPQPAWIIHGVKVWDPVQDSTWPGGSGTCRALQEDSYVYSADPHLHALTWALGRWQNGVRVAGIGAPLAQIDVASFLEGRNLNMARGWTLGGQVVTRPDTPWNSLKAMLQAGGAEPVLVGGMISCVNRAPRVSLATITRSDIVGKCSFSGTQARRSRINGIIPQYRSEAHDWQMVSAAAVSVADYVALDGAERTKEVTYPLVQDVNQVAQLARYDIDDAREAGPGSIPLKPWWLNYRIGDCLTFSPEDGFSIKVLVDGRALEAQSGVVSYTVRGETDGKHAFALGQTGTAPPIASLVYDTGVPAPDGANWTLTAGTDALPTLWITGTVGNGNADAVIFEYRVVGATDWTAAGTMAPTTTSTAITVPPGADYEAAVSYRVRGVIGARLVLAAVTSGSLAAADAGSAGTAGAVSDGTHSYDAAQIASLEARLNKLDGGDSSTP